MADPVASPPSESDPGSQETRVPEGAPTEGALAAADRLVAALEAEGERHGEGRFRVDREEAARKLRDHQLPDPLWYVLELVQAAVARGATRIVIAVDGRGLELSCDAVPFSAEELDVRAESLLDGDLGGAGLASLAVGLQAVMGLGPHRVRLLSGEGTAGLRLTIGPDAKETLEELKAHEGLWTLGRGFSVQVQLTRGPERLGRARRIRAGRLPEALLVKERCVHAPVSVLLGEEELAAGLSPPGARWPVLIQGEGFAGVGAFVEGSAAAAEIRLVHHGVWLETVEMGGLPGGFVAVIGAEGLRKDISRTRFQKDDAFDTRRLLAREARRRSLCVLAEHLVAAGASEGEGYNAPWARSLVREALRIYVHRRDFHGLHAEDTARALEGAPAYRICDGERPGGETVPLRALLERTAAGGTLGYVLIDGLDEGAAVAAASRTRGPVRPSLLLWREGDVRHLTRLLVDNVLRDEAWEAEIEKVVQRQRREAEDNRRFWTTSRTALGVVVGLMVAFFLLLGLLVERSRGEPESEARRTPEVIRLQEGCNQARAEACAALGRGYEEGSDPFPQSGPQARSYYVTACYYGHEPSCQKGRSPPEVLSETMSCTIGRAEACYRLSERFRLGEGVVRDLELAQRYRTHACGQGHQGACLAPTVGPRPAKRPR